MDARLTKLALSPSEAADSLGVSRSFFDQHIKDELKNVYVGARVLIPITSLTEWLESQRVRAA